MAAQDVRHRSAATVVRSRAARLRAIRLRYRRGQVRRSITGPIYAMAGPGVGQLVQRAGLVLVADDDASVSDSLKEILELAGHRVIVAGDGAEALHVLDQHDVDAIVLDINMPVLDGWAVLRHLGERSRPVVIVHSGAEFTPSEMREFFDTRPHGILRKPSPPPLVLSAVDSAVARARALAGDRDRAADERDRIADERDRIADERDRIADERDVVASGRDVVADGRDVLSRERERAADNRDREADNRDLVADNRDRVADNRDRAADARDRAAEQRDRVAEQRDQEVERLMKRARAAVDRSAALSEQSEVAKQQSRELLKSDDSGP